MKRPFRPGPAPRKSAAHLARRALQRAWPLLAGVALLWNSGCARALHASAFRRVAIRHEVSHFESAGKRIRVDVYRPSEEGLRPAAIVVHGSSGVHSKIPNTATTYARALAEQGLVAFVVHYFDATGTIRASRSAETRHYFTWSRVLSDAVDWVRRLPGVDESAVGMLGHSLGAYLAVGTAASNTGVHSVVLFGGGLEPFLADKIERMPPTLVCHGDADNEVPLAEAKQLVDFLRARGCNAELIVYPGERHTFSGPVASDALTNAARFFMTEEQAAP